MELLFVALVIFVIALLQRKVYEKHAFDGLEYSCRFSSEEVSAGDDVKLVETVSNKKRLPLPWLRSEITTSVWLDYAGAQAHVTDQTRFVSSFFLMKSYTRTERSWNVKCGKRGEYPVDKCILLSTDILGLKSFSYPIRPNASILVLPKPANLLTELSSVRRLTGDVLVRRHYIEDPFYIAGVREYQQRDAMNKIHWVSTARTGKMMVHNNEFTAEQNLLVILNIQSRAYESDGIIDNSAIECAINICAGFIDDTLRSGMPVRLMVNTAEGDQLVTVTNEFAGNEHVLDLLRILARLPNKFNIPFNDFLRDYCEDVTASDVVIVSAYFNGKIYGYARNKRESGANVRLACSNVLEPDEIPDDFDVFSYTGEGADI